MADPIIVGGIRVLAGFYPSSTSEDVISVNSWVFGMVPPGSVTEAGLDEAMDAVSAFYGDLASYFGKQKQQLRLKAYDMEEPTPRTPHEGTPVTMVSSAASLPSEVAACLSFYSGPVPRPRKRGRVYLGPLATSVIDTTVTIPRLTTVFTDDVCGAATNNLMATTGVAWGVLSKTTGDIWPITAGWCDNAFDIQRRRGEDPAGRSEFPG